MKNKEYQKLLVMALTASLTIGGVGISTMPVWAMGESGPEYDNK